MQNVWQEVKQESKCFCKKKMIGSCLTGISVKGLRIFFFLKKDLVK